MNMQKSLIVLFAALVGATSFASAHLAGWPDDVPMPALEIVPREAFDQPPPWEAVEVDRPLDYFVHRLWIEDGEFLAETYKMGIRDLVDAALHEMPLETALTFDSSYNLGPEENLEEGDAFIRDSTYDMLWLGRGLSSWNFALGHDGFFRRGEIVLYRRNDPYRGDIDVSYIQDDLHQHSPTAGVGMTPMLVPDDGFSPLAHAYYGRHDSRNMAWAQGLGWFQVPMHVDLDLIKSPDYWYYVGFRAARDAGWKRNYRHGWFYADGQTPHVWLYTHATGWLYHHPLHHPWYYHPESGDWLWLVDESEYPHRWFWSTRRGWLTE
jgi:hypothetical protein